MHWDLHMYISLLFYYELALSFFLFEFEDDGMESSKQVIILLNCCSFFLKAIIIIRVYLIEDCIWRVIINCYCPLKKIWNQFHPLFPMKHDSLLFFASNNYWDYWGSGCLLGIGDRRILRLLHRICRLNFACVLRELCPSMMIPLLLHSILLLLEFLMGTLEGMWMYWSCNLPKFYCFIDKISVRFMITVTKIICTWLVHFWKVLEF